MDFSIRQRSNQSFGFTYGPQAGNYTPGVAWLTNLNSIITASTINGHADEVQTEYGDTVRAWQTIRDQSGNITSITREAGVRADLVEIKSGTTTTGWKVVDQASHNTSYYTYQIAVGQFCLTSIVDPHGNTVTVNWDTVNGRISTVVDASGRTLSFNYTSGSNPLLANVVLSAGGTTREWDFVQNNGWLDHVQFPQPASGVNAAVVFHYNTSGNIDDLYDLNGRHWHYGYSSTAGLGSTIACNAIYHPLASSTSNQYDLAATTLAWSVSNDLNNTEKYCDIAEPCGAESSPSYETHRHTYFNGTDAQGITHVGVWMGNPIKAVVDAPVARDGNTKYTETFGWDFTYGVLLDHYDRRGGHTHYAYATPFDHGNVQYTIDPLNQYTYFYWQNDRLIRTKDPLGHYTANVYNWTTYDLTQTVVDAAADPYDSSFNDAGGVSLTTTIGYDSAGNVTSKQTGSVSATTYGGYDAYGNPGYMLDPHGIATYWNWDGFGNKTAESLPSPRGTEFFYYDTWNRLIEVEHPGPSYKHISYDNDGNLTSATDENGHVTTTTFDPRNRPVRVDVDTDGNSADNMVTIKTFDEANLLGTSWIGKGSASSGTGYSTYWYDERFNLTEIDYPDSTSRKFHFDGNGNRDQRTDGRNNATNYVFDGLNRLTNVNYPGGVGNVTNGYRGDNLRTSRTDATGVSTWAHNNAGQLTSCYQALPNKTLTYTYDDSGRKHTLAVGAQTWTYNFDQDRLWTVGQSMGSNPVVVFQYNQDGSVYIRNDQNGRRQVYGYDTRGRNTYISFEKQDGTGQDQVVNTGYL